MDCMAIDDADIRRACLGAVRREAEAETETLKRTEASAPETRAAIRDRPTATRDPRPAPPQAERRQPSPPPARPEAPVQMEEQTVGTRTPAAPPPAAPEPAEAPLRAPPESFTGVVTRIHQSILDRQVIALDDAYLFVSDQAAQGRFKVGQAVEAKRAVSRIRASRTWRLVGPARRPVDAFRVRCELDDIGSDDRRRCESMLDR